ncbi:MAG TPA: alpha-amylase family glycosyl hydrolase [Rhizomicrobium sp.]
MAAHAAWWRGAAVYQIYIRSFCDSNGDGQGDLKGVLSKFDYIASLGVDAIWLSPVHPSPDRDWGYDVSDYENVHPDYGTLKDFDALVEAAHKRGLKIILDEVLCHTSDEHEWFKQSLDAASAKADWYVWADSRDDGTPPNNWLSVFGGPAWAYHPARRKYYHHKFLRQQPKLSWYNEDARAAALGVLDFWLDRGVDGYRLDVANGYLHDPTLTDNPPIPPAARSAMDWSTAANQQRHLHDSNLVENRAMLDLIRRTVDAHGDRFVFGEFSEEFARSGAYLPSDKGLHAGYTFGLLVATGAGEVSAYLKSLAAYPTHWPCMSLSNHDVTRTVTRFGGSAAGDPALARLMLALLMALRGTVLLYQGEELGLPEVDLRRDQLRDPVGDLYYPVAKGRDGCRTPMPWDAATPNLGFTTGAPWLPLGPAHKALAVSAQESDKNSVLNFTRALLKARKAHAALRLGELELHDAPAPLLAFTRRHEGGKIFCVFNLGREPVSLPVPYAKPLDIGCGTAKLSGSTLTLGPLSAWFGIL